MYLPPPTRTGTVAAYDDLPLFTQSWLPEAPARAHVALVHGYAEHSGRYAHVAAHLNERGYALHAYDQRGYGQSGGQRAFIRSFDEYVVDLHLFLKETRARCSGGPLFLMGHSMGGAVAALYCLDHGARPTGLILSSPALRLSMAAVTRKTSAFVGKYIPYMPTVELNRSLISRDPEMVARAEADPLCYRGAIPARTGAELLRAIRRIGKVMEKMTLPLLLFHGTGDAITNPEGSRRLHLRAASSDTTLTFYENFYHETFNDRGRERVLRGLTHWLDERA